MEAQVWDDLCPIIVDRTREVITYGEYLTRKMQVSEPVVQVQAWSAEDRLADTRSRIIARAELLGDIGALTIMGAI